VSILSIYATVTDIASSAFTRRCNEEDVGEKDHIAR
jgi:hypothetical protein